MLHETLEKNSSGSVNAQVFNRSSSMYEKLATMLFFSTLIVVLAGCSTTTEDEENKSGSNQPKDPTVTFQITDMSEEKQQSFVKVNLSANAPNDVEFVFDIDHEGSTAVEGDDFLLPSKTLLIQKGKRTVNFPINIIDDQVRETEELIKLVVTSVTNATITNSTKSNIIKLADNDPDPVVYFDYLSFYAAENIGTYTVRFNLDRPSTLPITLNYDLYGTAKAGTDFTPPTQTSVHFDPLQQVADIDLPVIPDTVREGGETVVFDVQIGSGYSISKDSKHVLVINGDTSLNDTGVTTYSDGSSHNLTEPVPTLPGQDADFGYDKTNNYAPDGHAGFSYTKLDFAGNELPVSAGIWSCVRDNVTGLIWEVKSDPENLALLEIQFEEDPDSAFTNNYRAKNYEYTFYTENEENNGRSTGAANDEFVGRRYFDASGYCAYKPEDLRRRYKLHCNSDIYQKEINWYGHCGSKQWHVPTIEQLRTIVSYQPDNRGNNQAHIDTDFFLNTVMTKSYMSSTPSAEFDASIWCLSMKTGETEYCHKGGLSALRMVSEN